MGSSVTASSGTPSDSDGGHTPCAEADCSDEAFDCVESARQKTPLLTEPNLFLLTRRDLLLSLMTERATPESISVLRSFRSNDSIPLSSGERSGLIAMPGLEASFFYPSILIVHH